MNYFTINELTYSATAKANNLYNEPTEEEKKNLYALVDNLLDPIRERWEKPIKVNSGYRSIELNTWMKGAKNSQHMKGEAADITTGNKTDNKSLFDLICKSGLAFDQLIDEKDYTWLHISYSQKKNRKQILHLK
jgi:hypothetical protein